MVMKCSLLKYAFLFLSIIVLGQILKAQQVIITDAAQFNLLPSGTVDINASLVNNSANASLAGTFNFVGTIPYEISGTEPVEFASLSINNSAGVSLLTDVSVNTNLNLGTGSLNLGSSSLTIGSIATISGAFSAANMIIADGSGFLKREIAGNGTYPFPIGDNSGTLDYSLANLTFTSGNYTNAVVSVNVTNEKHPNNSSTTDFINRYWTVSQTGITDFSCNVSFSYPNEDIQGTESNIYGAKWDGSSWLTLNNASMNQFTGTVSSFSEFSAGELLALSIEEVLSMDDVDIIVADNRIIIRSDKNIKLIKAEFYSMLGQLVYSQDLNGTATSEISFNAGSDYYIAKIYTENQYISKKIYKN